MLSIEKCRLILGPQCRLSDAELESLRDELYALADISISIFMESSRRGGSRDACEVEDGGNGASVNGVNGNHNKIEITSRQERIQ